MSPYQKVDLFLENLSYPQRYLQTKKIEKTTTKKKNLLKIGILFLTKTMRYSNKAESLCCSNYSRLTSVCHLLTLCCCKSMVNIIVLFQIRPLKDIQIIRLLCVNIYTTKILTSLQEKELNCIT